MCPLFPNSNSCPLCFGPATCFFVAVKGRYQEQKKTATPETYNTAHCSLNVKGDDDDEDGRSIHLRARGKGGRCTVPQLQWLAFVEPVNPDGRKNAIFPRHARVQRGEHELHPQARFPRQQTPGFWLSFAQASFYPLSHFGVISPVPIEWLGFQALKRALEARSVARRLGFRCLLQYDILYFIDLAELLLMALIFESCETDRTYTREKCVFCLHSPSLSHALEKKHVMQLVHLLLASMLRQDFDQPTAGPQPTITSRP